MACRIRLFYKRNILVLFVYYSSARSCYVFEVQALMKRLRVNRVDSPNGESHFILEEFQPSKDSRYFKDPNLTEIKRISRKEAGKPLVLFREE